MDAERFDRLVKMVSQGASRRSVVAGLLGTSLASLLGWSDAAARPKKRQQHRKKQPKKQQRTKKRRQHLKAQNRTPCVPGGICTTQADCCPTERCVEARCVPGPGTDNASCKATGCPQCFACDDVTHECLPTTGDPCDDNNPCTLQDTCQAGICIGTLKDCDDGNACTVDTCNLATGACEHTQAETCNTGNLCRPGRCDPVTGQCVPGPLVTCPQCQVCNPLTGNCETAPGSEGRFCDDFNCIGPDVCQNGVCVERPDARPLQSAPGTCLLPGEERPTTGACCFYSCCDVVPRPSRPSPDLCCGTRPGPGGVPSSSTCCRAGTQTCCFGVCCNAATERCVEEPGKPTGTCVPR